MDGCIKYHCQCHSNGSWECLADQAEDTCQRDRDRHQTDRNRTRTETARICKAFDKEFTLGRPFSVVFECARYNCECHYNGTWHCLFDRKEDTCQDGQDRRPTDREPTEPPSEKSEIRKRFYCYNQNF